MARLAVFVVMTLFGGGCDLRSKDWAEETLRDAPGWTMSLVEPYLELALSYNRGTAFSFVGDLGEARWVLGLVALAMVLVLLVMALRARDLYGPLAMGMIAGGAIGNGVDRLFREAPGGGTGVVDFIRVNYPWGGSWPTFNVADVLVAVGVGMILVTSLRRDPAAPEPASEPT